MTRHGERRRAALLILATLALVVTVAALLYAGRLPPAKTTEVDSYAEGPLGHGALVELYEEMDVHVLVDREGVHTWAPAPVMFIEPRASVRLDGRQLRLRDVLAQRVGLGLDSIVVVPKWELDPRVQEGAAIRVDRAEVESLLDEIVLGYYTYRQALTLQYSSDDGPLSLQREDLAIPETATLREWSVSGSRDSRRVVLQERQTLALSHVSLEVLLGSEDSALVVGLGTADRYGAGRIILVSDPDLFHNFNLHRGDHALVARDLLRELGTDTLVIDEVFHGHGAELSPSSALSRGPVVVLIIHGLALALLAALAGARRFGREREPPPERRSTEGLIELSTRILTTGGRSERLTNDYVMRTLKATADRLGVPPAPSMAPRARALDRIAELRGVEPGALALVDELRLHDADAESSESPRSDLERAQAAYRLRRALLRPPSSKQDPPQDSP